MLRVFLAAAAGCAVDVDEEFVVLPAADALPPSASEYPATPPPAPIARVAASAANAVFPGAFISESFHPRG
jgi:hypothetical protein